MEPFFGSKEQHHGDGDDDGHFVLSVVDEAAEEVSGEADRAGGEADVAVETRAPEKEDGEKNNHPGEAREEKSGLLAVEPRAQRADGGPQGEGARADDGVGGGVFALAAPLPLEAEQRAKRSADQQGLEQFRHGVILNYVGGRTQTPASTGRRARRGGLDGAGGVMDGILPPSSPLSRSCGSKK